MMMTIGGPMASKKRTKKGRPKARIASASISADTLKAFYKDMLLIRRFEERAGQLYGMGHIGGFCHLYIGQEAIVVGQSWNNDIRIILFIVLNRGYNLTEEIISPSLGGFHCSDNTIEKICLFLTMCGKAHIRPILNWGIPLF